MVSALLGEFGRRLIDLGHFIFLCLGDAIVRFEVLEVNVDPNRSEFLLILLAVFFRGGLLYFVSCILDVGLLLRLLLLDFRFLWYLDWLNGLCGDCSCCCRCFVLEKAVNFIGEECLVLLDDG